MDGATCRSVDQSRVDENRLLLARGQDRRLMDRVWRFAALLREADFGQPVVIRDGSVYVAAGSDRPSTGTHDTPRSLTEPIVQHTLEPLVYTGPAEGKPEAEWQLKSPRDLLALKVCDMTMGSGAFLVQICRSLAERLVEAWENAERVANVDASAAGPPSPPAEGGEGRGEVGNPKSEIHRHPRRRPQHRIRRRAPSSRRPRRGSGESATADEARR